MGFAMATEPVRHPEDLLTLAEEAASEEEREELLRRASRLSAGRSRFAKVAICSGHMIDSPDRKTPRFPASKEGAVRSAIAAQLERWEIGVGALAICGGARGADLLFGEEALKRGASLRVLLAMDVEDFIEESVRLPNTHYVTRFEELCRRANAATQPDRLGEAPSGMSVFARTNVWMIHSARVAAVEASQIHALLVWDEKDAGDGPGGTADFAARVQQIGGKIAIINPTTIDP